MVISSPPRSSPLSLSLFCACGLNVGGIVDLVSASFGGLLGTAASVRGVKGVVIDGRCRDLSELRGLKLPVSPSPRRFRLA
jgi:hypothetical protein